MFPNGWPGNGLLVLRLVNGSLMIWDAYAELRGAPLREPMVLLLAAVIAGTFFLIGLCTPVAGIAVAVTELWIAFSAANQPREAILVATAGISIAMLGPGVWSVDALLFGRKRLDIHER